MDAGVPIDKSDQDLAEGEATPPLSAAELLKRDSKQLRGTILDELGEPTDHFSGDAVALLKHHGSYQQDDRDLRNRKDADGNRLGKAYSMMIRTAVPGGRMTAAQFLGHLDLADQYANKTLRLTTRQGVQFHGVLKDNLKATIKGINDTLLTTMAACGDVSRNVMCCPAPLNGDPVRERMQEHAEALAVHLRPRTTAYHELWLTDEETGEKTNLAPKFEAVEEPIYGERYLPRKFKIGLCVPEDNCVDVLTYDLGYVAVRGEGDTLEGYDVFVGGGQGVTPAKKNTEPMVAKRMCFVTPDEVLSIATAIVKVQRDYGNREDRKQARMKYLIRDRGLDWFRAEVEKYHLADGGGPLKEARGVEITDALDHIGWFRQSLPEDDATDPDGGKWFLGVDIEGGRIMDSGRARWKSGLRAVVERFGCPVHLTALHAVLLCGIDASDKPEVEKILRDHGVPLADELSLLRKYSMACVGLPTCGLSVTDSERVLPQVLDSLEELQRKHGLEEERITMHMTGCPNGCARPYTPDIGLVGKSKGRYTIFVGGNAIGTRLNRKFDDQVPLEEIADRLDPLFARFASERVNGESFGDFCNREQVAAAA